MEASGRRTIVVLHGEGNATVRAVVVERKNIVVVRRGKERCDVEVCASLEKLAWTFPRSE